MTTVVTQALNKVLADLTLNRGRLAEANTGLQQQMDVNKTQLDHFDLVIASINTVVADEAKLEALTATMADLGVTLPAVEVAPVSQPAAGGAGTPVAAPASEVGAVGNDANGSPVADDLSVVG